MLGTLNRHGQSADAKNAALVTLARALNDNLGEITGDELDTARAAGVTDTEIVEIIAIVALNIFTNIIGKATRVDVDFPKVALLNAAVAKAA